MAVKKIHDVSKDQGSGGSKIDKGDGARNQIGHLCSEDVNSGGGREQICKGTAFSVTMGCLLVSGSSPLW